MTARELAQEILQRIEASTLDPQAVVVRPSCMCDDEYGWVEAEFLDQVVRRYEEVTEPEWSKGLGKSPSRVFRSGDVEPGPSTATTLKARMTLDRVTGRPNQRLKLPARGGRLLGNGSVLSAAAAGRSLSAFR